MAAEDSGAAAAAFEGAAERAAPALGGAALRGLAARIGGGWPDQAILASVRDEEAAAAVLAARRDAGVGDGAAAAYLRGLAAGYARGSGAVGVETVWSGPASHAVPVRATAQALLEVIAEAESELVLMTYSARPHDRIREALAAAAGRGVRVDVVVETLQGAGGAISGAEPAGAFAGLAGVELWHWPPGQREQERAKAHAKLAAADRRVLLVSSANLTQSGVTDNIEAGLLIRGGDAPRRIAEHVAELRTRGVLAPLYGGGRS
ncbi:DISARM system phospholipase D-like protein DrmC [Streptomonospora salina]|uniref:Phosphatidylserine/phosphatidylglycerophosphate/ cardiolipin synthase-like enzyme n=1 Tax=Streptomonospora salina TaxID=104205 RepID=A0A841EFA4_9ACTN|nr:DISARM system phospholipase D-like protein DrmC [Streptomonospora salina]MBB5999733.1 phosphatidylserine/phosphatidylglycerophosphate/cardiolipin synthase-like enzyme [Streptomonospora salina]